jgi:hypothetical protein
MSAAWARLVRAVAWLRGEPVTVITGFVGACALVAASLGLNVSPGRLATVDGFIAAVLALLTRTQTTPTARAARAARQLRPTAPNGDGSYTITRRRIPETPVPGKPLGRHVHHDSRSLQPRYLVPAGTKPTVKVSWPRSTPILNQGRVGSCTGNATVGVLGTTPFYGSLAADLAAGLKLDEAEALVVYSDAEKIDGGVGYPPEDDGSSGLSAAKAAAGLGLIAGYLHITSVAAAWTAIASGPFIVGTDWWTGMDTPDASGLVHATGTVRGAHEYEAFEYDPATDLWGFHNSWGGSYGVAGSFWYSTADLTKLLAAQGDATVFTPLSAPAPTPTPTPGAAVVEVTDPAMVAHLEGLAAKNGETADEFLAAILAKRYPTVT